MRFTKGKPRRPKVELEQRANALAFVRRSRRFVGCGTSQTLLYFVVMKTCEIAFRELRTVVYSARLTKSRYRMR